MRYRYLALVGLPLLAAGLALATPPATTFLSSSAYNVRPGDTVKLQYATVGGTAGALQAAAWPADVPWLFVRAANTQTNQHDVKPARPGDSFVAVEIRETGVTVVGADCKPATTEMTGTALREFADRNISAAGLEQAGALPAADAKVAVQTVRSGKTLVRAAGDGAASAVATSKTGQAVEIQPVADPTVIAVGSDLPLRVFIGGDKKSDAKVQVTSPSGKTETFTTDGVGSGHVRIGEAGVWRAEFSHLAHTGTDPAAGWVIYTATLTFEVPGQGGGK